MDRIHHSAAIVERVDRRDARKNGRLQYLKNLIRLHGSLFARDVLQQIEKLLFEFKVFNHQLSTVIEFNLPARFGYKPPTLDEFECTFAAHSFVYMSVFKNSVCNSHRLTCIRMNEKYGIHLSGLKFKIHDILQLLCNVKKTEGLFAQVNVFARSYFVARFNHRDSRICPAECYLSLRFD